MMLPGFPMPLIMRRRQPVYLSGSWEAGDEGWVRSIGSEMARRNSYARTGSWSFGTAQFATQAIDYVIAAEVAAGSSFIVSAWHMTYSVAGATRSLQYRIGSGSFITLQTVTNNSQTYAQLSGSFTNPGSESVTIRLEQTALTHFDDWEIIIT